MSAVDILRFRTDAGWEYSVFSMIIEMVTAGLPNTITLSISFWFLKRKGTRQFAAERFAADNPPRRGSAAKSIRRGTNVNSPPKEMKS